MAVNLLSRKIHAPSLKKPVWGQRSSSNKRVLAQLKRLVEKPSNDSSDYILNLRQVMSFMKKNLTSFNAADETALTTIFGQISNQLPEKLGLKGLQKAYPELQVNLKDILSRLEKNGISLLNDLEPIV